MRSLGHPGPGCPRRRSVNQLSRLCRVLSAGWPVPFHAYADLAPLFAPHRFPAAGRAGTGKRKSQSWIGRSCTEGQRAPSESFIYFIERFLAEVSQVQQLLGGKEAEVFYRVDSCSFRTPYALVPSGNSSRSMKTLPVTSFISRLVERTLSLMAPTAQPRRCCWPQSAWGHSSIGQKLHAKGLRMALLGSIFGNAAFANNSHEIP